VILTFTIPGDPVSWARPRKRGNATGFYTAPKQAQYAEYVAALALEARPRGWDASLPMRVEVVAVFKRGKACKQHDGMHPTRLRYDADNLGKLVLDGMVGVVLEDDGIVVDLRIEKRCEDPTNPGPRTVVTVAPLQTS